MVVRRVMSVILILSAALFVCLLYFQAPWYLDQSSFLIRPSLSFALPLFFTGLALYWRSAQQVLPLSFHIVLVLLGLWGLLFVAGGWPPPHTPYTWEDGTENLFVVGVALFLPKIFLWAGCLIALLPSKYL